MRIRLAWVMLLFVLLAACGGKAQPPPAPPDTISPQHPQFNRARGFGGFGELGGVLALLPAGDGTGDIYAGGYFTTYNETKANHIIRLNPDGSVDSSFVTGSGFDNASHTTPSMVSVSLLVVSALARTGDETGDIYVGGAFTTYNGTRANGITRLHADGRVDSHFVTGDGFNGWVRDIIPAGDGTQDIYVGGWFTAYNGTEAARIIRLNADGSVDSGFAIGSGFDLSVNTLALAKDGSGDIYVGGSFSTYNGTTANGIVRLNADGSVNSGFSTGNGFNNLVRRILLVEDGTGDIYVERFLSDDNINRNEIIRLNSNGSARTYGSVTLYSHGFMLAFAQNGTGDIYVGQRFQNGNGHIIRLNTDGRADSGFVAGIGFNGSVNVLIPVEDGSGDIYVGGSFTTYNRVGAHGIIRLNLDGSVDSNFVIGSGVYGHVLAIEPVADGTGDLYVGGSFQAYNGTPKNGIARLNVDGGMDSRFVIGNGFDGIVYALALSENGRGDVYAGGYFTTYNGSGAKFLVRLHPDGSMDSRFVTGNGFNRAVYALLPAKDGTGDIYVGGDFSTYNGTQANRIVRLNADGSMDPRFVIGSGFNGSILVLALAGDGTGDLYVGGEFTTYNGTAANHIIRLNADGSVDTGFVVRSEIGGPVFALTSAGDGTGDIYVVGGMGYISPYNSTGVNRIVYQDGRFSPYLGPGANWVIRLNSDGSVDTDFAINGFSIFGNNTVFTYISAVFALLSVRDGTGDLYVGGRFSTYNGGGANGIIRLNPDGSVDTGFVVGDGFNSAVLALARAEDGTGDIYVGGGFGRYKNTIVDGIARLGPDGTSY